MMPNLNLNDLLRYGFAGSVFLILAITAYCEPQIILSKDYTNGVVAAALLAIGLTIGCILYALHRAVPYPFFYWLFAKATGRIDSTLELDIVRWRNSSKSGALQPRMGDWGAQVHFLYCVSWAGLSALLLGQFANWSKSGLWCTVLLLTIAFFLSALWHHYRYQKWEKRVFLEDRTPNAS
jgi:hypothetical protein